ncbi:peptidase S7 [Bacillota bacterium LX-D]|nr:peptidase S7 [Bacillota bacterium LX-D]
MLRVKGIGKSIIDKMVKRTLELSQGRNVGCLGFVDEKGYISSAAQIVDGGLSGIPLRTLLAKVVDLGHKSLLEGFKQLPENTVFITTSPGKTGLITDVTGVDFFNMPIISVGVKNQGLAGVGIIYPEAENFDLATKAEKLNLATLTTKTMKEEKEVLRENNELGLRYLELGGELEVVDIPVKELNEKQIGAGNWNIPRLKVIGLNSEMAKTLVAKSMEIGQGREVAAMGIIDKNGIVQPQGEIISGGIGFVPARLLASSSADISGKSLNTIYSEYIAENAVIVHTHPGGTGVMHIGDAHAGPGTWGRPIIAIGCDKDGVIRGATVIEAEDKLFELADEDEILNLNFFEAKTPEEEAEIRNRKFGIAQDYTGLCKTIELI